VWESRTPPDYSSKSPITIFVIGLFAFGGLCNPCWRKILDKVHTGIG